MSKIEDLIEEKRRLQERYDAAESILINMNVGVNPSICTQSTMRFIGVTKEYHHKLTPLQSYLFREFLSKEKDEIRNRTYDIDQKLEKADKSL